MTDWLRAAVVSTVLLTGACGIFDDEERLEGERIPVRDYRATVQTAPQAPPVPAADAVTDTEQEGLQ